MVKLFYKSLEKGAQVSMKTWNDYKEHIKVIDSIAKADIEESERIAVIVSAMIEKHNEMK